MSGLVHCNILADNQLRNHANPSSHLYRLWIHGEMQVDDVMRLVEAYPETALNANITDEYTVMTFTRRPDNIHIGHLIAPHIFVLQANPEATVLFTNENIDDDQAALLSDFLRKIRQLTQQKPALKR